jgi:D-alanyl-D-alanine carboxypeptidase/D-alanyl-D-alanine-endopeptidase (penicillin-binding protein 4)
MNHLSSRGLFGIAALIFISSPCSANNTTGNTNLPTPIAQAIKKSGIPAESIALSIDKILVKSPVEKKYLSESLIHWQANIPMNPASTMKLVTSLAAMEVLGPQYRWKTDLLTNGQIQNEILKGDLLIRGSGDPKLIPEEINKMLLNLKSIGVKKIDGNLIFDRSAYDNSVKESSFSDGEPTRLTTYPQMPSFFPSIALAFSSSLISLMI